MSNSDVFWDLFRQTGGIGLYLLYRYSKSPNDSLAIESDDENNLGEMTSEGG